MENTDLVAMLIEQNNRIIAVLETIQSEEVAGSLTMVVRQNIEIIGGILSKTTCTIG